MARYVDPVSLIMRTELMQLINVDATDCCGVKLLQEFTNALEEKKIPLDNLFRLACDNAPVMVGNNNSFKVHLTKRLPHLLTLPCVCHSLALIAIDACNAAIPVEIDEIISGTPNFVNGSPKRFAEFKISQRAYEDNPSRLLRFAPTRWLSRQIAVSRILPNWDAILGYLIEQSSLNVAIADKLLTVMNKPMTKAYLIFLKFVLDPLEKTNAHFQANQTLVHELQPSLNKLFVDVIHRFIKPNKLAPLVFKAREFKFGSIENHLDLSEVDLGTDCEDYLRDQLQLGVSESIINQVRCHCETFFQTTAEGIVKRLPLDHKFLSDLTVLSKYIALFDSNRESSISRLENIWTTLAVSEGNLIQEEWRFLYYVDSNLKEQWG